MEPEAQIEKGQTLIRGLREEEALAVLEPWTKSKKLAPHLKARALVYSGVAYLHLGQEVDARARFSQALDVDAGAALPGWVSPRVRSIFLEVRTANRQARDAAEARLAAARVAEQVTRAPPPAPESKNRNWVIAGLGAGAAATALGSGASFLAWNSLHTSARNEPVAIESQRLSGQATNWFYAGEVLAGAAVTLGLATAIVWLTARAGGETP